METRPQIKPALTVFDKALEITGWCALAGLWLFTIIKYPAAPDTIPIHFNAAGEADSFGSKQIIFFLPVIGTALFLAMTWLNRYPHIFNYPVRITAENALRQYTVATRLIRFLKLAVTGIFLLIVLKALGTFGQALSGVWFLPVVLAIIFIPLAGYIAFAFRSK